MNADREDMPSPPLVTARQVNDAWVIGLPARLWAELEEPLYPILDQILSGSPKAVILDCGQVVYTNSAGIGVLVECLRRVREHRVSLVLAGLSGQPRMVLEKVQLLRVFSTCSTVDAALAAGSP